MQKSGPSLTPIQLRILDLALKGVSSLPSEDQLLCLKASLATRIQLFKEEKNVEGLAVYEPLLKLARASESLEELARSTSLQIPPRRSKAG